MYNISSFGSLYCFQTFSKHCNEDKKKKNCQPSEVQDFESGDEIFQKMHSFEVSLKVIPPGKTPPTLFAPIHISNV